MYDYIEHMKKARPSELPVIYWVEFQRFDRSNDYGGGPVRRFLSPALGYSGPWMSLEETIQELGGRPDVLGEYLEMLCFDVDGLQIPQEVAIRCRGFNESYMNAIRRIDDEDDEQAAAANRRERNRIFNIRADADLENMRLRMHSGTQAFVLDPRDRRMILGITDPGGVIPNHGMPGYARSNNIHVARRTGGAGKKH